VKNLKSILFICSVYKPNIGGVETIIEKLSSIYNKKGIKVKVLTKKFPANLQEIETIKKTKIFRIKRPKNNREYDLVIKWLKKYEKELRSDLIHLIGIRRPMPFIGHLLSKRWKVPYVITFSGGDVLDPNDPESIKIWKDGGTLNIQSVQKADIYTAFSKDIINRVKKNFSKINTIKLIYAGISPKKYVFKLDKSESGYILTARRLYYSKGIDILIKSFSKLAKKHKNNLIIVGDGPELENLVNLTKSLELEKRVKFIGSVNINKLYSLMRNALIHVCPSRSEGGGNVNIEAQAVGCATIGSDVGGIPEYILHNKTGLIFEPENIKSLTKQLNLLLTDKLLRKNLIKNAYSRLSIFNWEIIYPKYLKLYESILNKRIREFKPWSNFSKEVWKKLNNSI